MTSRVVVIVQARFGSARLPGKAMRALAGRPMLSHVFERAKCITGVDQVVLATTGNDRDDPLVVLANEHDMKTTRFLIKEEDVLARMRHTAVTCRANIVVRVTGDCPLLDPEMSSEVIRSFREHRQDGGFGYASNVNCGWPDGIDTEVFSFAALDDAFRSARARHDREHVTPWMHDNVRCLHVRPPWKSDLHSHHKWSVDTAEDFERVRRIAGELEPCHYRFQDTLAAEERAQCRTTTSVETSNALS